MFPSDAKGEDSKEPTPDGKNATPVEPTPATDGGSADDNASESEVAKPESQLAEPASEAESTAGVAPDAEPAPEASPVAEAELAKPRDAEEAAQASIPVPTSVAEVSVPAPTAVVESGGSGIADEENVYRLYNPTTGEHLYTADFNEAKVISTNDIWRLEGVSFTASRTKGQNVWRLLNKASGLHLWTSDANERNTWLKAGGWRDEGVAWYGQGPVHLVRLYNPGNGQHLYTQDAREVKNLTSNAGWVQEGQAGWSTGDATDYVPVKAGWVRGKNGTFYLYSNGSYAHGMFTMDGKRYYSDPDTGALVRGRAVMSGGNLYRTDANGAIRASLTGSGDAELDAAIGALIKDHIGLGGDDITRVYDFVRFTYHYRTQNTRTSQADQDSWEKWSIADAKELMSTGSGNCYRYAALTTWTIRALGYDCHMRLGYLPGVDRRFPHAWCEIDQPGNPLVVDSEMAGDAGWPDLNWNLVTYKQAPTGYLDLNGVRIADYT